VRSTASRAANIAQLANTNGGAKLVQRSAEPASERPSGSTNDSTTNASARPGIDPSRRKFIVFPRV